MSEARPTHVLIVEDSFLVSEMIQEALESGGYSVVGKAADGLEAIHLAQTLRPDVVLMDLELPGDLDGIEATQRIQATCPMPVIALTAYETPALIEQASAAGMGAYLTKPPNLRELDRAITISVARFNDLLHLRRLNTELQAEIAERKQAEEYIRQMYATEQQRAAALALTLEQQRELDRFQREFIQNVSHELRTPLSLIEGHAEALQIGWLGDLRPEQRESIGVISRRAQMLTKLADDIIGVLEIEQCKLTREPLDLELVVRASLADFQASAEKAGLILSADIAPGLPPVSGDSIALRRMLDHLLDNARKFNRAGGRVTARLQKGERGVILEVSDTGIGIPSDRLGRVFERFYPASGSAARRYGGAGLGLALVKGIVEAHGGQITVTSQVGVGTTFTALLPVT